MLALPSDAVNASRVPSLALHAGSRRTTRAAHQPRCADLEEAAAGRSCEFGREAAAQCRSVEADARGCVFHGRAGLVSVSFAITSLSKRTSSSELSISLALPLLIQRLRNDTRTRSSV